MRTALLALVLVAVSGCVGQVGDLPDDYVSHAFAATVLVNPARPVPGRMVSLNVELTSHSNTVLMTEVVLRVVRSDGRVVYEDSFRGVKFHPEEIWNLTQGFLPATDDGGAPLDIEVIVRDNDTGAELWRAPHAAVLVLG